MSLEARAARLTAATPGPDALSITEFYARVDRALRSSFPDELWITGEIRSLKVLPRGHCFIDLVDPTSAEDSGAPTLNVKCWATQWRSVRSTLDRLGIALDAGMVVRVRGEVQLYKARGSVDFILRELDTEALLGKVAAERARLIKALVDEELFDRNRRIPVPRLPLRVGLVSSPGTEGHRDFLGRLERSAMAFDVRLVPSQVQGRDAPASIAAALRRLDAEGCDVIALVRGGGSKADLACFDAEPVARAIATSSTPVWTGIGHTGDQSVADEVANRSFITPTECGQELARLATDAWRSIVERGAATTRLALDRLGGAERSLDRQRHGVTTLARAQLVRHADRLEHHARTVRTAARAQLDGHGLALSGSATALCRSALRALAGEEVSVAARANRLVAMPARQLESAGLRVDHWRQLLGAFDYRRQLARGYSVTRDAGGAVVRSVAGLRPGAQLVTLLADGTVDSEVTTAPTRTEPDRTRDEGKS